MRFKLHETMQGPNKKTMSGAEFELSAERNSAFLIRLADKKLLPDFIDAPPRKPHTFVEVKARKVKNVQKLKEIHHAIPAANTLFSRWISNQPAQASAFFQQIYLGYAIQMWFLVYDGSGKTLILKGFIRDE